MHHSLNWIKYKVSTFRSDEDINDGNEDDSDESDDVHEPNEDLASSEGTITVIFHQLLQCTHF